MAECFKVYGVRDCRRVLLFHWMRPTPDRAIELAWEQAKEFGHHFDAIVAEKGTLDEVVHG